MQTAENYQPKQIITKFNQLYIQTRSKYLAQFPNGRYVTFNRKRDSRHIVLNDGMLKKHLAGELTYGVFNGGYFNKFITFDVDFVDHVMARWVTFKIIDVLVTDFNIMREDIHVSISGGKGFHVDLFFDEPLPTTEVETFYRRVTLELGDLPNGQVEFRPNWNQGVKLPLGVHQKTGRRCWFVDNQTLEPMESFDYVLGIEPMDATAISDRNFGLTDEQTQEFESVALETDITVNAFDHSKALQKAARILESGRLTESNTRHNTTFVLACFFNSQGFEREEAVEAIMEILLNTPREYFSKDSTSDHWRKEAVRLTDYVFDNDIAISDDTKVIRIYKSEILAVLQCGTFRQKQMAFAMLVTSKRYGQTFYLTTKTAMSMIGTKSRQTVQNAIKALVEGGFIEYLRKGEIDHAKTKETGQVRHKPNKYRLLANEPPDDDPLIEVTKDYSLVDVAYELCDVREIRQYVKRYEYDSRCRRM